MYTDREAWHAAVYGAAKSRTQQQLNNKRIHHLLSHFKNDVMLNKGLNNFYLLINYLVLLNYIYIIIYILVIYGIIHGINQANTR